MDWILNEKKILGGERMVYACNGFIFFPRTCSATSAF